MDEQPNNPNDPLGMISQSLDGELSPADQQQLDQALVKSESLQRDQEKMRSLHTMLERWSAKPVDLDWENFAALIQARIESNEADEHEPIDDLLQKWGDQNTLQNDIDLVQDVMSRVQKSPSRRFYQAWPIKLGGMLAAAASIALVVMTGIEQPSVRRSVVNISRVPLENTPAQGHSTASPQRIVVAFAREPVMTDLSKQNTTGISFGSVGAGPIID